ncbi:hypothetical protein, partial [Streptomyces sp. WAC04114]|uniref:hypothetical protein n=1 Tax=Streptomyces sp. WAC04114 TaxID=2867961 RepID=UPI001C8C82FD
TVLPSEDALPLPRHPLQRPVNPPAPRVHLLPARARGARARLLGPQDRGRGAAAPVLSAEDDIPDPWGRTREELYACALEIDRALSGLVRLWGRVIRRDVSC